MHRRLLLALSCLGAFPALVFAAGACDAPCEDTLTCDPPPSGSTANSGGAGASSTATTSSVGGGGASTTGTASGGGGASQGGGGQGGGLPLGATCLGGVECASGQCVDDLCCDTACDGSCESCEVSGSEGTCTPVPAATDPDSECGAAACDGAGECASGAHVWSNAFGTAGGDEAITAVAVDESDNTFIAGSGAGIDLGGGATTKEYFLAKFDSDGMHVWTHDYDAPIESLATDSQGAVIAGGGSKASGGSTFNFGGSNFTDAEIFIFKLNAAGAHQWSHATGGMASTEGGVVTVDSNGNAFLGAFFGFGQIDLGGGAISPTSDLEDLVVAKYSPTGMLEWANVYGSIGSDFVTGMATTSAGELVFSVVANGFGGVTDPQITFGTDTYDVDAAKGIVVALGTGGGVLWSRQFPAAMGHINAVASHGAGGSLITGSFSGSLDLGNGDQLTSGSTFAIALDAAGDTQDAVSFTDPNSFASASGAITAVLRGNDTTDSFRVERVAGNLAALWGRNLTQTGLTLVYDGTHNQRVAVGSSGRICVAGSESAAQDFGGGNVPHTGGEDAFVACYAP